MKSVKRLSAADVKKALRSSSCRNLEKSRFSTPSWILFSRFNMPRETIAYGERFLADMLMQHL